MLQQGNLYNITHTPWCRTNQISLLLCASHSLQGSFESKRWFQSSWLSLICSLCTLSNKNTDSVAAFFSLVVTVCYSVFCNSITFVDVIKTPNICLTENFQCFHIASETQNILSLLQVPDIKLFTCVITVAAFSTPVNLLWSQYRWENVEKFGLAYYNNIWKTWVYKQGVWL